MVMVNRLREKKWFWLILVVAVFFRFYNLLGLQYYSFDDELYATMLRRVIVDHKLLLISPAPSVEISLGPFWYWLSIPIYAFSRFNPIKIVTFGSFFGLLSTGVLYITGKKLGGSRVGLIASFLYAGSFLMALSDRRWWPLSLNAFLVTVAIYSLYQMIKGKLHFSLPLAIAASFSWHADLTLAIIILAILMCKVWFRLPLMHKAYFPGVVFLIFSFLPFGIFEFRHPGAVSGPVLLLVNRMANSRSNSVIPTDRLSINGVVLSLSHSLFSVPTNAAENYLYPHSAKEVIDVPGIFQIMAMSLFLFPLYLWKNSIKKYRVSLEVLYIFLGAFFAGLVIANLVGKVRISQHYYVIVWPVIYLLAAFAVDWLIDKKYRFWVVVLGIVFVITNIYALVNSQMRYRLDDKMQLTNFIVQNLSDKPFSLYGLNDVHLFGGGFGGMLLTHNRFPSNRSYYGLDWVYQAFSLYAIPVVEDDNFEQVVIIYPSWYVPDWLTYFPAKPMQTFQVANMKTTILRAGDN